MKRKEWVEGLEEGRGSRRIVERREREAERLAVKEKSTCQPLRRARGARERRTHRDSLCDSSLTARKAKRRSHLRTLRSA